MNAQQVLRRYEEDGLPEFAEISLTDVNQRGNFGNTPLHIASVRGSVEEVDALLQAGADPNASGELGHTPLHEAALQGHVEVVRQLLKANASRSARDDEGRSARECAAITGHEDVVALLDSHSP